VVGKERFLPNHRLIQKNIMNPDPTKVSKIYRSIMTEFLIALNLPAQGWIRMLLSPILHIPANRFARMAAELDDRVEQSGTVVGMSWFLHHYIDAIEVHGAENIPSQGPLLFASNHPGAYDGVCVLSSCRRDDINIVVSDIPFSHAFPSLYPHLVYVAAGTHGRMLALREMRRRLQQGGALLIFPTGYVDPDPDLQPGSLQALERWSPSIEWILRQVPETQLVPVIASSVLAKASLQNPLTRLKKTAWEKRKLAEFLQVSQQLIFSKRFLIKPRLTYGPPISGTTLKEMSSGPDLLPAIIQQVRQVLISHSTNPALL
jgi:hypothetical protein